MSNYETNLTQLKRDIHAQKTIYTFRNFLYSINRNIRFHWFDICRMYLENERSNIELTATENDRLRALLVHWNWNEFETNSTNWWYILSMNHSHSISLMTLIHMWTDNIDILDSDVFETSTQGLR